MLKIISTSLIIFFSLSLQAQKKSPQKKNSKPKTPIEAAVVSMTGGDEFENDYVVDTLKIKSGKPSVFLIDIDQSQGEGLMSQEDQEENELRKNFKKTDFQLKKIVRYTYLLFENGEYLDLSGKGNTFQATAFWSGDLKESAVVQEGKKNATEFVAAQLGLKKQSSYVTNTTNYKKEIAELLSKDNFTDKSKLVMNAFLQIGSVPEMALIEKESVIFNRSQEKVKSITTTFILKNGKRMLFEKKELNPAGQPTSNIQYDKSGKISSNTTFIYKNNRLSEIKGALHTTKINYSNDQMIMQKNVGNADETEIYTLSGDHLLRKSFMMMSGDQNAENNSFTEDKLEKDCVKYYIDGKIWTSNCSIDPRVFPFTYTYTSFQDGKILQKKEYKILKKSDQLYEEYFANNEDGENEKLKLDATYLLNDKNLLTSIDFLNNSRIKKVLLEYTFYH